MDYLSSLIFLVLVTFSSSAFAVFPAGIMPETWCASTGGTAYNCTGPNFGSSQAAALYYCQTQVYFNKTVYGSVKAIDLKTNPLGNSPGLTAWGTFSSYFTCTAIDANGVLQSSARGQGTNHVQALPLCTGGAPINNYAPASCSGQPFTPPVACSSTPGVVISAYHALPIATPGCYAGCLYAASNTSVTTYNGAEYEAGSWTGLGQACAAEDIALFGGAPGNTQNVGAGPGLVASDLVNLATEQTLQQVLQAIQAGDTSSSTLANANKALLEQIAGSTATIAAGSNQSSNVPDPDGLEALYAQKLASTQVDADGKLTLPGSVVDVGATFSNVNGFIGSNSCPVPPSFTVKGQTYTFDLTIICSLAQALSYLVVALASLAGVKIFTGGM